MMRTAMLWAVAAVAACAQSSGPQFEVASLKPGLSPIEARARGERIQFDHVDPGRFEVSRSLQSLLQQAYRLEYYQKISGPEWMGSAYYEIRAKIPDGAEKSQLPDMLRGLLEERLHLVARLLTDPLPVYILTVAKDGPKLKEAAADADARSKYSPAAPGRHVLLLAGTVNGYVAYSSDNSVYYLEANKIAIHDLARLLSSEVELPVIDRTGLAGMYEVSVAVPGLSLRAAMAARKSPQETAIDPDGVNLPKAVEKLGLKLEKTTLPIGRLVIDHVEKTPEGN